MGCLQRGEARGSDALPAPGGVLRPQVEVWLNRVLDRMCATLRHEIPEAVVTYEEKPREQWIFDYPAQVGRVAEGPAARGRAGSPQAMGPRGGRSLDGGRAARLLPGGAHVHADLVDHGGGPGLRAAGGRLRERHQRLQQEAGMRPGVHRSRRPEAPGPGSPRGPAQEGTPHK